VCVGVITGRRSNVINQFSQFQGSFFFLNCNGLN